MVPNGVAAWRMGLEAYEIKNGGRDCGMTLETGSDFSDALGGVWGRRTRSFSAVYYSNKQTCRGSKNSLRLYDLCMHHGDIIVRGRATCPGLPAAKQASIHPVVPLLPSRSSKEHRLLFCDFSTFFQFST